MDDQQCNKRYPAEYESFIKKRKKMKQVSIITSCLMLTTLCLAETEIKTPTTDEHVVDHSMPKTTPQEMLHRLTQAKQYSEAKRKLEFRGIKPEEMVEHYQTLNLGIDADKNAIKTAYKKQALRWHPDKWSGDKHTNTERDHAEAQFKKVSVAYEQLSDFLPKLADDPDLQKIFQTFHDLHAHYQDDFSQASSQEISNALDQATALVRAIHQTLDTASVQQLKPKDLNLLQKTIKQHLQQLRQISNGTIHFQGESIETVVEQWANSTLQDIQQQYQQVKSETSKTKLQTKPQPEATQPNDSFEFWIRQRKSHVTSTVYDGNTPFQQAVIDDNPYMAQVTLDAAAKHGITKEELLKPIQRQYTRLMNEGKDQEAYDLLQHIYRIEDDELSTAMYAHAQQTTTEITVIKKQLKEELKQQKADGQFDKATFKRLQRIIKQAKLENMTLEQLLEPLHKKLQKASTREARASKPMMPNLILKQMRVVTELYG